MITGWKDVVSYDHMCFEAVSFSIPQGFGADLSMFLSEVSTYSRSLHGLI